VLEIDPGSPGADTVGVLPLAAACLCCVVDNNLTQRLSLRGPFAIVRVKTPGATTRPRYYSWADLMMRVHAADVLECRRCHSPLRILAQIHPPDTTRAIVECLGLSARPPPIAPARRAPEEVLLPGCAPEREDDAP
jgi:hypothetical protein